MLVRPPTLSNEELAALREAKLNAYIFKYQVQRATVHCICELWRRSCRDDEQCAAIPRGDHLRGFKDDNGRRILTSQPYALKDVPLLIRESEEFAAAHGLKVRISPEESWHYPGWTVLVEFRSAA